MTTLRQEQASEANVVKEKLASLLYNLNEPYGSANESSIHERNNKPPEMNVVKYSRKLDPEPLLKLRPEDKGHDILDEVDFIDKIVSSQWACHSLSQSDRNIGSRKA